MKARSASKQVIPKSAGRSLVSSAERNGLRLICVTLNDPETGQIMKNLYNWAFSEYKRVTVSYGDMDIEPVPVISGEQECVRIRADGFCSCTIPKEDSVDISVYLPKFVYAGVDEGEQAGLVAVKYDGAIVGRIPLYYAEEVALDKTVPLTVLEKIGWAWFFANRYGLNRFGGTG
jgi:D-alanyl-D-alanine carboxypeptidase/D-alanyl-D-alanine carboxypeptidase (penicillin-binding protein 5/6)